ncbi:MAG TPA: hypothetical protein VFS19_05695, partial [Planctomycetota bacterium]|nr:hypothetical protein [Planctomycetota bacterium]
DGQLLDVPGIITFLNPLESRGKFTAMKAFFDIYDAKCKIKEFVFLGKEGSGSIVGKGDFWFTGKFKIKVSTVTGSFLGIPIWIANIPGAIFDLLKSPLKLTVEGDLKNAKIFEE